MEPCTAISEQVVLWGIASRALPGESVCGDMAVVSPFQRGVMLAVVDGLGHGQEATAAARLAIEVLERYANEPPESLVRRCHAALAQTRGVVAAVVSVDRSQNRMAWVGVGNVEARLVRVEPGTDPMVETLVPSSGVIGYRIPDLRPRVLSITTGDLLLVTTDGIAPWFANGSATGEHPRRVAARILERHFKGTDDALVLVARFVAQTNTASEATSREKQCFPSA